VLALRGIGDLAGRIRRDDERVVGRVDWRKPVGVGAETAFIGIASRGVDDGQRGASAPLLKCVENGFDGRTLLVYIAFLPDHCIGRDHVGFVARLSRRRTASRQIRE